MKQQIAVLSGDLVNSSEYEPALLKDIITVLKHEFKGVKEKHSTEAITFSLYRGDSFQGVVENVSLALIIALQIKTAVIKYKPANHTSKSSTPLADIRIAIGVGESTYQKQALEESNGAAFQFSGRSLDSMKGEGRTITLVTANEEINYEFAVSLKFLDGITDRWSLASAEVVYYLLKNYTEQQIADEIGISQAAVNSRKRAAGWEEIQLLLKRYQYVAKNQLV